MVEQVARLLPQAIFVLVTLLTVVDYGRHGGARRRDVALMFATLGLTIAIGWVAGGFGMTNRWLSAATGVVVLAQPYLLLRVVQYFRPVPRAWQLFGLAGMVVS